VRARRRADRNIRRRKALTNGTSETSDRSAKAIGLAIAGALVTLFAALPFVTIAALYAFVTVYAIVRAIGPGGGEDPVAILVGFVVIASTLVVVIAGAVYLLGRAITPGKRGDRTGYTEQTT
jgi:hypothetical protein